MKHDLFKSLLNKTEDLTPEQKAKFLGATENYYLRGVVTSIDDPVVNYAFSVFRKEIDEGVVKDEEYRLKMSELGKLSAAKKRQHSLTGSTVVEVLDGSNGSSIPSTVVNVRKQKQHTLDSSTKLTHVKNKEAARNTRTYDYDGKTYNLITWKRPAKFTGEYTDYIVPLIKKLLRFGKDVDEGLKVCHEAFKDLEEKGWKNKLGHDVTDKMDQRLLKSKLIRWMEQN